MQYFYSLKIIQNNSDEGLRLKNALKKWPTVGDALHLRGLKYFNFRTSGASNITNITSVGWLVHQLRYLIFHPPIK